MFRARATNLSRIDNTENEANCPGGLRGQSGTAPGTGLASPETGSQNRRYRDLSRRQRPHARYLNRGNARILRAILQRPGNAGSHRTAWWAREDSNLQPDRYERAYFIGNAETSGS